MSGLRDKALRRLGASLAAFALYLQLVFAGSGMLATAVPTQPADAFGGHALCLAGLEGATQPAAPSDDAPVPPTHDHLAFCCLWHLAPAITPTAAVVVGPIAYAAIGHAETGNDVFIPGPHRGPGNARAPPTLA
jgi:hypothetical protein